MYNDNLAFVLVWYFLNFRAYQSTLRSWLTDFLACFLEKMISVTLRIAPLRKLEWMFKCPVKCSNVQMFSQMFWEKRKSIFKEGRKGHHHIVICSPGFNHFFLLKWKMSAFCMWSKIRDEAKGNLQKLQNQKPSPVSPLWNQLKNIAIIGEKCTSEEQGG